MKPSELVRGTQVVYIPNHAESDPTHPDCERGFVTGNAGEHACFVRYFHKNRGTLRTTSCSEKTPVRNLALEQHHSPSEIAALLTGLGYTLIEEE